MITLTQAFRLCSIRDDEIVYIRYTDEKPGYRTPYLGLEVRKRFDMKHSKVCHIDVHFSFGEYEGMEFVIRRNAKPF